MRALFEWILQRAATEGTIRDCFQITLELFEKQLLQKGKEPDTHRGFLAGRASVGNRLPS